jgi:hypothetical protein
LNRILFHAFGPKGIILSEKALLKNDTDIEKRQLALGCEKEQGQLLKLDISLSTKTIRKSFRLSGREERFRVH